MNRHKERMMRGAMKGRPSCSSAACRGLPRTVVAGLLFSVLVLLAGCGNVHRSWVPYDPVGTAAEQTGSTDVAEADTSFLIWGEPDTNSLEAFKLIHPELTVTVELQDPANWQTQWLAALAAGKAADVFIYEAASAGWASTLDVFEDLSKEAYTLDKMKSLFSDAEWQETFSFDLSEQLHLPVFTYPSLLFYRADILERYGFPSEPAELASYLEEPSRWLNMVRVLHGDGHHAMEWKESPWNTGDFARVPYDTQLQWRMSGALDPAVLQVTAIAEKEGLIGNINVWDDVGKKAIQSDRLVMFPLGAWGVDLLPGWAPEQSGLWRATRMPMGIVSEWGTKWMSMNQSSSYKAEAWEFVSLSIWRVRSYYESQKTANMPYFGYQRVMDLADRIRLEMEPKLRTPIDKAVSDLFFSYGYLLYDGGMPARDFLAHMEEQMEARFAFELAALQEERARGRLAAVEDGPVVGKPE